MHLLSKIRLAVFFCLMSVSAHAWNLPTGSYQFESIADRVYVMHGPLSEPSKDNQGFMNNPAFIESQTGLILIDPGSSLQVGRKILEEIGKISSKPVLAVFNTHIHGDHWLGNQAIRLAYPEVDIYAHADTITQANDIEGQNWLDLMLRLTEGHSEGTEIVTANKAVAHNDSIEIDGELFKIHSFIPAHTDTDIMIEHVGSQTIFMGDNSFSNRIGRFDGSSSIVETIKALKYIAAQSFKTVVPGHGPSANPEQALKPYLDYLLKLESVVVQGQEDELEDYEIKAATLDQFENWNSWVGFERQFGPNLNKMFLELEDF